MIKDKATKTIIAKDETEAAWWNEAERAKQFIQALNSRISRAKKDLKVSSRDIVTKFRDGARASIKRDEVSLKLQKELLKFYNSKIE